ncbi:3-dehydrosphinganine reductase [Nocardioides aromaticivorans]|uniref:3-dehydrosphinganine reductase n=1 Tax=Nocardioides aromaticivorans TaxID=200618 RepID=A0A7Y9ZN56_9ACTN|nr:SDR family oxidoreductase [Nocardioides aromaticivorans]NYI46631.1 3-dehydrosphinganine reductase [Nocardioides aromaticivorans]
MTGPLHQRAFVFGGSEGIGLAVAGRLAAAGTEVVILSRSEAKLGAALAQLGDDALARAVDVTDAEAVQGVVDALVAEVGVPDLVVTTAGYARPGWLEELPAEDVAGMVATNLVGTINVARAVLPHLRRAGGGTVVTTSSMAGLAGVFGYTVYSATKFGVVGFSEALRREVRPYGVRVLVLCPPNTLTPGFDEENRHKPAEVLAAEESVKTLTPDEVAEALMGALGRRRGFLVVPGRDSRLAAVAIRHLPAVVDRALRRP